MPVKACSIKPVVTVLSPRCWGIKHLVVAINKMDLVDYSEETFTRREGSFVKTTWTFAEQLPGNLDIRFVPLSALEGDNVASQSESMPWYSGPTLLEVLETVEIQRVVDASQCASRCSTLIARISIFVATPERWHPVAWKSGNVSKCCPLVWNQTSRGS
ncbi:hypothetical protein ACVXHA_03185 [Escherichia coli]